MDKMRRLGETIRTLMEDGFSGYIRINFTQGSLGRIEKSEEFEGENSVPLDVAITQARVEREMHHEAR
jgi:hypothetical protein